MGNDKRWLAPLAGLGYFLLLSISFLGIGDTPDPIEDSAKEVVNFYVENEGKQITGAIIEAIAATLFVFFAGALRRTLRNAEGDQGMLSAIAFAGAIIFATGLAIDATIAFTLTETAGKVDETATQALSALYANDFVPFAVGTQIFLLATGLSILRHGALPKWIGYLAIVFALIAVTPVGFASFIGGGVLVAIMSVMLTKRARGAGSHPTHGTPVS